jgi:hypothetical protein
MFVRRNQAIRRKTFGLFVENEQAEKVVNR